MFNDSAKTPKYFALYSQKPNVLFCLNEEREREKKKERKNGRRGRKEKKVKSS